MGKFKVGDLVECINDNPYNVTTSLATLIVNDVLPGEQIEVRLLSHKLRRFNHLVGVLFTVSSRHFSRLNKFKGNLK